MNGVMGRERVAGASEVPVGGLRRCAVAGTVICLAHTEDGKFYAVADQCSHEDYSLSEGDLIDGEVECPQHGSRFDLVTGEPHALPATAPIATYPVTVEGGDVFVEL